MSLRMGLREANQQFSKAVKAVKAGKEVIFNEATRLQVSFITADKHQRDAALEVSLDVVFVE